MSMRMNVLSFFALAIACILAQLVEAQNTVCHICGSAESIVGNPGGIIPIPLEYQSMIGGLQQVTCDQARQAGLATLIPPAFCAYNQNATLQAICGCEGPAGKLTPAPTKAPTQSPTKTITLSPTSTPTALPTASPIALPTAAPTAPPTTAPTALPTAAPTMAPTDTPTTAPSAAPVARSTSAPTAGPSATPTTGPSAAPVARATSAPSASPISRTTAAPIARDTAVPSDSPVARATTAPSAAPVARPTPAPILPATPPPSPAPVPATPVDAMTGDKCFSSYLWDADSDSFVSEIDYSNDRVDKFCLPNFQFNIEAKFGCSVDYGNVRAITFQIRGPNEMNSYRGEMVSPYFAFGDDYDFIIGNEMHLGTYSVTLTALFSSGNPSYSETFEFDVVECECRPPVRP